MKHTLLYILAAMACLTASAYDFTATTDGGVKLYFNLLADNNCALTNGGTPYSGHLAIPGSVTFGEIEYLVTAIASDAFLGCEDLTSVELPDGLASIGSCAFSCCNGLTSIDLPNSVRVIGPYAFSGCSSLRKVELPQGMETLCDYAFYGCSSLAAVSLPGSLTTVGYNAFLDTRWWNEQSEGLVYYNDMLLGCHGDLEPSVVIKDGTRLIANGAFYGKCNLSWVDIPQSVTAIGSSAFYNCSGLTTVVLPQGLEAINEYAFFNCGNLTSIELPSSLRTIGWYAFSGCRSLTAVAIPDNVGEIGAEAFRGCTNLITLSCHQPLPPSCYENAFNGVPRANCTLCVPEEAVCAYQSAKPWSEFNILAAAIAGEKERCAVPFITVTNGKLSITTETKGATCHYSISSSDIQSSDVAEGSLVNLTGQYNITAYAKADGLLNSDIATAILVWVNPEQEYDKVINMEQKKAVVLRIEGEKAILCGTEMGENIVLYNANGLALTSLKADENETVIPYTLQKGQVYIVQYANRSIKFVR